MLKALSFLMISGFILAVPLLHAAPSHHERSSCDCLDGVRPSPPRVISAVPSDRGIRLSWEKSSYSQKINLYRIYRLRGTNNSFLPLVTVPDDSLSITDDSLEPDDDYYYAVTSENRLGLESDSLSPVIQVIVNQDGALQIKQTLETGTGWDNIVPQTPLNFMGKKDSSGHFQLEWSPSPSEDVLCYKLYFSSESRPLIEKKYLIATLTEDQVTYTDSLRTDSSAYYAIIAVDRQNNLSSPAYFIGP